MRRVLVLNGPNLGMLGRREPEVYGTTSLEEVEAAIADHAAALGLEVRCVQSNHEGKLIDLLEEERDRAEACILNPGALSHTSVALLDAVRWFGRPVVEVHISNVHSREPFRRTLISAQGATAVITGLGVHGYIAALDAIARMLDDRQNRTAGETPLETMA